MTRNIVSKKSEKSREKMWREVFKIDRDFRKNNQDDVVDKLTYVWKKGNLYIVVSEEGCRKLCKMIDIEFIEIDHSEKNPGKKTHRVGHRKCVGKTIALQDVNNEEIEKKREELYAEYEELGLLESLKLFKEHHLSRGGVSFEQYISNNENAKELDLDTFEFDESEEPLQKGSRKKSGLLRLNPERKVSSEDSEEPPKESKKRSGVSRLNPNKAPRTDPKHKAPRTVTTQSSDDSSADEITILTLMTKAREELEEEGDELDENEMGLEWAQLVVSKIAKNLVLSQGHTWTKPFNALLDEGVEEFKGQLGDIDEYGPDIDLFCEKEKRERRAVIAIKIQHMIEKKMKKEDKTWTEIEVLKGKKIERKLIELSRNLYGTTDEDSQIIVKYLLDKERTRVNS